MIDERRARFALLILVLAAPAACDRPHRAPRPAPVVVVQPPAPPARNYVMVCKSSRTGLKARCGTPDAVMVGMKPE
jgi:hypothetical protein